MGGGVSKKKMAINAFTAKMRAKGGVSLNSTPWDESMHGPNPDDVEVADVIACLTKYYKDKAPEKVKRVCGEVDQFIDNLGALFRSLERTYGVMPKIKPARRGSPQTTPGATTNDGNGNGNGNNNKDADDKPETNSQPKDNDQNQKERDSSAAEEPKRAAVESKSETKAADVESKTDDDTTNKTSNAAGRRKEPEPSANQKESKLEDELVAESKQEESEKTTPRSENLDSTKGSVDIESSAPSTPLSSPGSKRSMRRKSSHSLVRRNTIVNDSALSSFASVREPRHNIEERLQILVDLAQEVLSYAVPEEVEGCKHSKTQNGDKITVWPDGTQYQKSANGTTVLVLANQRVIQRSQDKVIMKRPNGTLVQRSLADVFQGKGGYIINQKSVDGLQAQFNADGFREDFEGGGYLQVTNSDPAQNSKEDFLADPGELGRIEEHTQEYHLVVDKINGRTFETRNDGTQLKSFSKKGIFLITYKDGLEIQHNRDGTTIQKSPDGTLTQQNPDGSVLEAYFDGSKVHYKTDGSVVEEVPDEYVRVTEPDGTERMSHVDMTFTVRRPDGTFFKYDQTGKILEHTSRDGTDMLAGKRSSSGQEKMDSKDMKGMATVSASDESKDTLAKPSTEMFRQTTNILGEILSTEKTYVSELEWIDSTFCKAIPDGIDRALCSSLTPGIPEILEVTNQFLGDVNTSIEEYASPEDHYDTLQAVGQDFVSYLAKFKGPYRLNMRNYANASQIAGQQGDKKIPTGTKSLIMKLNNKLILPVQRCMRYYMLLQQVLKLSKIRVTNTNPQVADIIAAYKAAKDFATFCNAEELQGQSQLLLNEAPKLAPHIKDKKLMLQLDLCKASKNATPVVVYLYNNGVLVQRTLTEEIKAFDVCAPNSSIAQNNRSSKKPPSLEIVSCGLYPKASAKKSKRGWMLRESKRKMLSQDLQIRELDKLYRLTMQLVNNALLEASIKDMEVPQAQRSGYEAIIEFKKVCEEDMAHGFISSNEYERLIRKLVLDCGQALRAKEGNGNSFHIQVPIAVVAKDKDFELREGVDLDLTSNFGGDLEAAKTAVSSGRLPLPVAGAYLKQEGKKGVYHHIIAAWKSA